jgi:glycosyltransferase involved in cell wall biosynthesis
MLSAVDRLYGPLKAARVIPNGRASADFSSSAKKEPFVLSVGRLWDEAKNIRALAEAAENVSWPILVAGESSSPSDLTGLKPLGQLSSAEIADWMARARIYALPAKYEPFGLSILEAALSGCALVLGDIPSLRENWTNCALFVDPDKPREIARAIQALIDDPQLRASLGREARQSALRFGIKSFGEAYLNAYQELTEKRFNSQAAPMAGKASCV